MAGGGRLPIAQALRGYVRFQARLVGRDILTATRPLLRWQYGLGGAAVFPSDPEPLCLQLTHLV